MGLEIPPAFTAHPSKADGEQVSEAGGPWGHPPICAEQEEASAPPSVPAGCSVWPCKDSVADGYLFPTAASCGRRQVFGKGLNKTSCSHSRVSPGTQTPTWHPGYQCHPLNSSCLPAFPAWNPCWVVLCDFKQLPNSHPGCVGSEGWCPYVYPHTLATQTQRPALPAHVNSKPIIYQLVCKVLWNRKGPV